MIKCRICNKRLISIKALSQHIRFHNITSKHYYNKYLRKVNEGICRTCKKKTKFISLSSGYQKFCNSKCSNNNKNVKEAISNKRKKWWTDKTNKKNVSLKISKTVKGLWEDENSIFNSESYRKNLSNGRKNKWEKTFNEWNELGVMNERLTNLKLIGEFEGSGKIHEFECKKCKHIFKTIWNYAQQGKACPKCNINNQSKPEKEILEFIENFGIITKSNSKKIIPPKELDIYIPDMNIAFEYNGLYWHCESRLKDKNYHLNKVEKCEEKGIKLIQIFEDEWLFKKDIVLSRIKHIIGKNDSKKIYARKCNIKEISTNEKNKFLLKNHIQGIDISKIRLGAFYNEELVSVMTFSKGSISKGTKASDFIWELNRFCTDKEVIVLGAAGKLLKYFKNNFEWEKIFSYADRRWSNGDLYNKLGFRLIRKTKPNYWYLKNGKRIHRFTLRKSEQNNEKLPESIIRKKQGYEKIWDCGSLRFELENIDTGH